MVRPSTDIEATSDAPGASAARESTDDTTQVVGRSTDPDATQVVGRSGTDDTTQVVGGGTSGTVPGQRTSDDSETTTVIPPVDPNRR